MRNDLDRVLFHESTILARLDEMAGEITREYRGKDLTVLAVMNGSLMFLADLLRRIDLPLQLDILPVSSYRGGTTSTGSIRFRESTLPEVRGRHVLVLDDILDSGLTLHAIRERLLSGSGALSVRACVLLKKRRQRVRPVGVDFTGFEIGDEFVVGYGLDYRERYRNLPLIGVLSARAIAGGG